MIGVSRGSCEGSKNRWLRLLDLQEQRSFVVGQEQADRAERADAADPDDFEGDVLKMIAPQQYAPILLQCLGIGDEGLACIELMAAQMAHERRLVSDAPTAADLLHEAKMVLPCRKHAGKALLLLTAELWWVDLGEHSAKVDAHAPSVERRQSRQIRQLFAIALAGRSREPSTSSIRHFRDVPGNNETGGEAFDVPFEWGG